MEDAELRNLLNDLMDKMSDLPPERLRIIFADKSGDFERTIGNTTYVVKSHFNPNSKEDIMNKVRRLLSSENNE